MNRSRGFTLIELLVVIAIIGILSSVVLASLNSARSKARDAQRLSDIRQVQLALELYADSNGGAYPDPDTGDTIPAALVPDFIAATPSDPLAGSGANQYVYIASSTNTTYCLGADLENDTNTKDLCNGTVTGVGADYDYVVAP